MTDRGDMDPTMQSGVASDANNLDIEVRIRERSDAVQPSAAPNGTRTVVLRWSVLAAVLLIAALYVGSRLGDGWVPADDGLLAQGALRVLQGQLPHRDFADNYTGGLSILHAAAFYVFGVKLMSLRFCVFAFFLAWMPAVYSISLRFTSAPAAGLVTLLAVAWSFPNYPAAMPSWYNLFFATFGALALLRYLEVRKWRWLFVAGMCGGVSLLIKVIGAYYIAGVLLFLVFVEQSEKDAVTREDKATRALPYRVFCAGSLLLFLFTVIYLFHKRLGAGELYDFVLPAVSLVALIFAYEGSARQVSARARFRRLLELIGSFSAGVLAPIIVFLIPYARSGAPGTVISGIQASVLERSAGLGVIRPIGPERAFYALAVMGLIAAAMYRREFQGIIVGAFVGLSLSAMLYRPGQSIVSGVWCSAALFTPLVVCSGVAIVLQAAKSGGLTRLQQQRIVLLIALAGLCSFAQYPFAAPIYLSYSLPLTFLAAIALVVSARKRAGTFVLASVMGFYLLYGFIILVPDHIYELTHQVGRLSELQVERGRGLRIEFAPEWRDLIHFLQQRSPNGLMYAGNDCPEFYFLTGLKNVTNVDGGAPPEDVLKALQSDDLKLVVINEHPFFPNARMSSEVRAEVVRRFPEQRLIGIYRVFWRQ